MNIYLLTNLTTFPAGTAAAKRIRMIAKALTATGYTFSLYTNSLSYNQFNNAPRGRHGAIYFEYLHGTADLRVNKLKKLFLYTKGLFALYSLIRKMDRERDIVYVYAHGNIFNVITVLLCKRYRIKIVQEINEWDFEEIKAPFKKLILHQAVVKRSDGAVVISKNIKDTVLAIKPAMLTVTIPVLEDPEDYNLPAAATGHSRYCFWMGQVNGYLNDVLLIVAACAEAYRNGQIFDLVISGPCNNDSRQKIEGKARACGYPAERLKLAGYISEQELDSYCKNAFFFIIPLWNNQKSFYRFPTKIASFMFCGKPVLTADIGEVGAILTDRENTLFFEPGNEKDLAAKIEILCDDPALYDEICHNTLSFARKHFSYSSYKDPFRAVFYGYCRFCTGMGPDN